MVKSKETVETTEVTQMRGERGADWWQNWQDELWVGSWLSCGVCLGAIETGVIEAMGLEQVARDEEVRLK